MTKAEWRVIVAQAFAGWWGMPMEDEQRDAWFPELERFDRDDVLGALRGLLRESPHFPPRLGEVIVLLEPKTLSFDEAMALMDPTLRRATTYGEKECIRRIAEVAGPVVAGWASIYGAVRLATEPVFNPEYGGAVLKRQADSYGEQVATVESRHRAVERAQRVLAQLEQAERPQLESRNGAGA